jgi:hypothetical protein
VTMALEIKRLHLASLQGANGRRCGRGTVHFCHHTDLVHS